MIILKILSYLGLAFTILPALLVFAGKLELEQNYLFMIAGMVIWFCTAPFWMKDASLEEQEHEPGA